MRPGDDLSLGRELPLEAPLSEPKTRKLFRPFTRVEPATENSGAITDLLVTMRETLDRQGQRHDELMTYLSQLPKAMEMIPENSRLQAEALAAIRQHLENQGSTARQLTSVLEKIGQASTDQRRIFDAVRSRLDMLAENDQRVVEHFQSFANAITTASDTTRAVGEVLQSQRDRDARIEKTLESQGRRHTVLMSVAVGLSAAALLAACVAGYAVVMMKR